MLESGSASWLVLFAAEAAGGRNLREQTCALLRRMIGGGQLPFGSRLPASRVLAADLGVSRVTVEAAYGQLEAEGYLRRRVGQGSFVSIRLDALPPQATAPVAPAALSRRGERLTQGGGCYDLRGAGRAFAAGEPDLAAFPLDIWQRLQNRQLKRERAALLGYGDPQGYEPLRRAIAGYLAQSRGVSCDPGQVLILTSSQQALQLAAALLLDPGDAVWLEDPGYRGARVAFAAQGARLVPVAVDADGMDPAAAPAATPPRLIYLTPSHQYPTGVGLSLPRRMALLELARREGAWIVEDDYDSEFHYDGRPLPAMQGLDRHGRVLYVGTFSKVMFPSLRLAYAVLPPGLAQRFAVARSVMDGQSAQLAQATMADFIEQGHFAAHLRQMRQLYRSRRDLLREGMDRHLRGRVEPAGGAGGMQLAVWLGRGEEAIRTRRAASLGVVTPALAPLYLGAGRDGWRLGFSGLDNATLRESFAALVRAFD